MKFLICKLKPKTALHLGEREGILETTSYYIHSDTLFSAFCNVYRLLYGKEELEKIFIDLPFQISSTFPYFKDTLFFPLPKNLIFKEKFAKRIEFVSQDIFEKICNGEEIENYLKQENITEDGKILITKEIENIYSTYEVPRVTIDSVSSSSEIFYFGKVNFNENAGLYFLIKYNDLSFNKKFEATLRTLVDEGIGGDRTAGCGTFEQPEFNQIELNIPPSATYFITLSLYLPTEEEVKNMQDAYYELIERKGYIYSQDVKNLRRKSIRMFKEGSVFKDNGNIGKLVDITPDIFDKHKVYRYGYCFKLPYIMR